MDFDTIPIIKMEIERLRSTIMAHLGVHGSELGEAISEQIDQAIADYPFNAKVREIVYTQVTKSIESYFAYGHGNKVIKDAIDSIFTDMNKGG